MENTEKNKKISFQGEPIKSGSLCSITGITKDQLRYYENVGLVHSEAFSNPKTNIITSYKNTPHDEYCGLRKATKGGINLYDNSTVETVSDILIYKALGLKTGQIVAVMNFPDYDRAAALAAISDDLKSKGEYRLANFADFIRLTPVSMIPKISASVKIDIKTVTEKAVKIFDTDYIKKFVRLSDEILSDFESIDEEAPLLKHLEYTLGNVRFLCKTGEVLKIVELIKILHKHCLEFLKENFSDSEIGDDINTDFVADIIHDAVQTARKTGFDRQLAEVFGEEETDCLLRCFDVYYRNYRDNSAIGKL